MSSNPTVLITGAGTGIGAATAKYFAANNFDVILIGRRKEKLQEVAQSIKTKTYILPADLKNPQDTQWVVHQAMKEVDRIHCIVNNAGTFFQKDFLESDDELWKELIDIHLMAPVRLIRGLLPHMINKGGGSIVNVASTAGLRPVEGMGAYATLKAALIFLTQSLALEFAGSGIRVNAVCPGIVETDILGLNKLGPHDLKRAREQMASLHPLGRTGKPEEIAAQIYHLCDPECSWMTGVILPVDGGISLK